MSKTRIRPNAVKSRSEGIKPYLEKAKTAFPNMMRRVTQTARDWVQKEKHSEKIKPYLFDQDIPYPEIDEIFPTPLGLEFPGISSEEWTNIGDVGEEGWKFKCVVHCTHTTKSGLPACKEPVRCWYGAWTKLASGGVDNWKFYAREPYTAKDSGVNITGLLNIEWRANEGVNGELHIFPKNGSWADIVETYSGGQTTGSDHYIWLQGVYIDKGQREGKYYDPGRKVMITIVAGRSICDDKTNVRCGVCPVDPVMTFDDDSTPDTIAPGGNITLYVKDGLGPYTWSVSGTGYTLDHESTDGVTNTLNCAAGSCDTEYVPTAHVTVTDTCGTSVDFYIMSTGGAWHTCGSSCCWGTYTGSDAYCYSADAYPCRLYLQCADDEGNYHGVPYPWPCVIDVPGVSDCSYVQDESCTDACPNGWYQSFRQSWAC